MKHIKYTSQILLILIIFTGLVSCGKKQAAPPPAGPALKPRVDYDPSPSKVVENFLKALKSGNYSKAYKYVYVPYTDKVGYITQVKNTISDNDISIVSYKLLATQIYDRTSTVVMELNTRMKSPKTGSIVELNHRSVYDLGLFEGKWLVTNDRCIENCMETEPVIEITE